MTPEEQRREAARLDYETLRTDAADRVKYQVDLAQGTLRSLILINGGAIVALFTLIGNQADGLALDPAALKRAFAFFIAGLVSCLMASFGGFLSQHFYATCSMREGWDKQAIMLGGEPAGRNYMLDFKRGSAALIAATILAAASLLCFGLGSWSALSGVIQGATATLPPY